MPQQPIKTLIAEDDASVRRYLETVLGTDQRFDVVAVVSDGSQALWQAQELELDLAVLDLRMPVRDGLEVAAVIKARRPEVKVAIVTGDDSDGLRAAALDGHVDAYLVKPASLRELGDRLAALLEPG